MSVGIVTSAFGGAYYGFLLPWSESILNLNTDPDWITIVHDGVPDDLRAEIDDRLDPVWITDKTYITAHPQAHVNAAIDITYTDWIIKADVDDQLLPHALDGWQDSLADIVNFGYRIAGNDHISRKIPAEVISQKLDNPIGSCSPFRRWIWEMNPFRDLLYDDWAFWIEAAREGATFDATERVDYIYTVHDRQFSRHLDPQLALAQIRAL